MHLIMRRWILVLLLLLTAPGSFADRTTKGGKKSSASAPTCADLLPKLGVNIHSFVTDNGNLSRTHHEVLTFLNSQGGSSQNQEIMGRMLTSAHAGNDNSFQVKNPLTGNYDKTVAVPVSPYIAPIPKSQFQRVVQATEPLLQAFRKLLQRIYSSTRITVESLGLQGLPADEAQLMIDVIKKSIYLEPLLINNPHMAEYPFISVAGLDGAIGDPGQMQARFFEVNLGTPSGLSNNAQLEQEYAKLNDPIYSSISAFLDPDDTFELLRQTIESNAKAWTGVSGMSVIVSPGEYNAAHPDVVAISRYSGMPIVRAQDLYEGNGGYIYWNVGPGRAHPRVTGIYGRREESYFLQSELIPMISPDYANNEELGKRLGLKLRPGAIYSFIRNDKGDIIDVERDISGNPKFERVWDTIGVNPNQGTPSWGFATAISRRRLYYSALGGRVVDDKRLFPIIAKYLVKAAPGTETAQPVRSLPRSQYDELYAHPERFFVKEPGNSGGVGVHPLALESEDSKRKILAAVKAHPENFEVQYISDITTLPIPVMDGVSMKTDHVPTDLRLFVMLDAKGQARAGRNSLLLRTAPSGQLLTNTSRGGGYGIGMVFNDDGTSMRAVPRRDLESKKVIPVSFASHTRIVELEATLGAVGQWMYDALSPQDEQGHQAVASELVFRIRSVMDLMPKSMHAIIAIVRRYGALGYSDKSSLRRDLSAWMDTMSSPTLNDEFPVLEAKSAIEKFVLSEQWKLQLKGIGTELNSGDFFDYKPLRQPEVVYRFDSSRVKLELGRYSVKNHPFLELVDAELKEFGGELRMARVGYLGSHLTSWDPPYFWVNYSIKDLSSYLKPIIAIDLTVDMALPALAHEHAHFRFWRDLYLQAKAKGMGHDEAIEWAAKATSEDDNWLLSEHAAVNAEMAMEQSVEFDPLARTGHGFRRAQQPVDRGYVNRTTYPEFYVLRNILSRMKMEPVGWKGEDESKAKALIAKLVTAAIEGRSAALAKIQEIRKRLDSGPEYSQSEIQDLTRSRDLYNALGRGDLRYLPRSLRLLEDEWKASSVFDILTLPFGREELHAGNIYQEFMALLEDELRRRGLDYHGLPQN